MSEAATGTGASGSALVLVVVEGEDFWACPSEERAGTPSREEGPVKLSLRGCAASAGVALSAHTAMPIASVRTRAREGIDGGLRGPGRGWDAPHAMRRRAGGTSSIVGGAARRGTATSIPADILSRALKTIVRGYRRPAPACADLGEMLQDEWSEVANGPLPGRLGNIDAAQDQGSKRVFATQRAVRAAAHVGLAAKV